MAAYDPRLADATVEFQSESAGPPLGIIAWDEHVVHLTGFDVPIPDEVMDVTVDVAPFGDDFRAAARRHKGHALLVYGGDGASLIGQYVALVAVAAALAAHGAIVVLNEASRSALPIELLQFDSGSADVPVGTGALDVMADLPLLLLYCGFVKYEVENFPGVWMRTFGCDRLGLPDLAMNNKSYEQAQATFDLFVNVLTYLRKSGASLKAGDTMRLESDAFFRVRHPTEAEYFLDDAAGSIFVAEVITPDNA